MTKNWFELGFMDSPVSTSRPGCQSDSTKRTNCCRFMFQASKSTPAWSHLISWPECSDRWLVKLCVGPTPCTLSSLDGTRFLFLATQNVTVIVLNLCDTKLPDYGRYNMSCYIFYSIASSPQHHGCVTGLYDVSRRKVGVHPSASARYFCPFSVPTLHRSLVSPCPGLKDSRLFSSCGSSAESPGARRRRPRLPVSLGSFSPQKKLRICLVWWDSLRSARSHMTRKVDLRIITRRTIITLVFR